MSPEQLDALSVRRSRAEFILVGAIALVALLVLSLLAEFSEQRQLHARTIETVATSRGVRDETLAIMQALTDVKASRLIEVETNSSASRRETAAAMQTARVHITALERHCAVDAELAALAARLAVLIEQDFEPRDAPSAAERTADSITFRAELRAAIASLLARANAINDLAREAERGAREQIDVNALALAVLALLAAALAAFAVRLERKRWRLARDSAAEANAAKTRFLAVASHDMRQPLHALTLYLSALERRVETQEARDILKKMERATQSMTGMFATLLDLARVQAGAVTPEYSAVRLQEVIDRILAEHPEGQIEARPTRLSVHTDPMLFERALSNLVANAMKHGGGACSIEAAENGEYVDIIVADNGPGIAPEDHERIFAEFVRLDTRGGDGLGLGLAIVKRISRLLDMPLSLSSASGQGARFTLRAKRDDSAALAARAAHHPHAIADANVLLLDDDALAREAIAGVLRDFGGVVCACATEREVVAAIDDGFTPDVLVMDLRINGDLHGLDIARRTRTHFQAPPPVIIITGDTGPETLATLRASGFAWLIKPIDQDRLVEVVAAQLAPRLSAT